MRERSCCRCPLCRIESELLADFSYHDLQDRCRQILSSAPELCVFSGPGALLEHLRLCRDTTSSDATLRALLQARRALGHGVVERIFILAFLPSMHTSLRHLARRYPWLSPDDSTQQALHSLLRFLDSEQLRARQTYLGFAISRRIKRSTFEWAERELRARILEPDGDVLDFDSPAESLERFAFLRHFLDLAVRRGMLSDDELNLLIEFKLENGSGNGLPESASNAHRQRLKRLLAKLRRLAGGQTGRRRRGAPS